MSKWKNRPDGRTVRRQKIPARQWAWLSIEALESPAYRALSLSGLRILTRIQIEHAHHGGTANGKLPVTFRNFHEFGIHPNAIAPAIREVAALGFIRITREGVASSDKEYRLPNMFALTHRRPMTARMHQQMIGAGTRPSKMQKQRQERLVRSKQGTANSPQKAKAKETSSDTKTVSRIDTKTVSRTAQFKIRKP